MPRLLTPTAIRAAQQENNEEVFLVLLTIQTTPEAATDIRVVNNTENITSRGLEFLACPFGLSLPDSSDSTFTTAQLEIDNVDTRIWQGVRALNQSAPVLIELVLASEPDTVVLVTDGLILREASATLTQITGTLLPDTVWQRGFPADDFDPAQNPGMFGT